MKEILFLLVMLLRIMLADVENNHTRSAVAEVEEIVDAHNRFRRSEQAKNMRKLAWDEDLAQMAETWARNCHFIPGHNTKVKRNKEIIGQNLYVSNRVEVSYTSVIESWYQEKEFYDFGNMTCRVETCAHYIQVVWAETSRVGCASVYCDRMQGAGEEAPGVFVVCNYRPAGNYLAQPPYIEGEPCEVCQDSCDDGLCGWSIDLSRI